MNGAVYQVRRNANSNILRVKLKDLSDNNDNGKTGLLFSTASLLISTICDNEATATAYAQASSKIETIAAIGTYAAPTATKCRFIEVDATNHPGLYEIQIADARFNTAGAKRMDITISGAADMEQCNVQVEIIDPSNAIQVGVAAAGAASTITIATALGADSLCLGMQVNIIGGTGIGQSRTIVGYVNSTKVVTVDRPWTTNPDTTSIYEITYNYLPYVMPAMYGGIEAGTAQAGGTSSITLRSGASAVTDFYKYQTVMIYSGTGAGQTNQITGYNGSTKVATVETAWATQPDSTSLYVVLGRIG